MAHTNQMALLCTYSVTSCAKFSLAPPKPNEARFVPQWQESVPLTHCSRRNGTSTAHQLMVTNINTASSITTDTVKQKRSKAIDMVFIGSAIVFAKANLFVHIGYPDYCTVAYPYSLHLFIWSTWLSHTCVSTVTHVHARIVSTTI